MRLSKYWIEIAFILIVIILASCSQTKTSFVSETPAVSAEKPESSPLPPTNTTKVTLPAVEPKNSSNLPSSKKSLPPPKSIPLPKHPKPAKSDTIKTSAPAAKVSYKRLQLQKRVTHIKKKSQAPAKKLPDTKLTARTFPIQKQSKSEPIPEHVKTAPKKSPNQKKPSNRHGSPKPKEISSQAVMSAYLNCWPVLGKFYKRFYNSTEKVELKVKLSVSPTGKVASVTILQNSSTQTDFDDAVIDELKKISFPELDTRKPQKVIMAFSFPD